MSSIKETYIENIKSKYIYKRIFGNLPKKKLLQIMKYNKKAQNSLNIKEKDFKEFTDIEIEIYPAFKKYGKFINLINKDEKKYFHMYFDDSKEEIKRNSIRKKAKVKKIRIIINYKVKSLNRLFENCECIESIYFNKFDRDNIKNMNSMFYYCTSLKDLNLTNFNTTNVTDMSSMFCGCSSLKELNLSNFNTNNVINMSFMFDGCSSLEELNLSNFNTNNVTDMSSMFDGCSSLVKLNLLNFDTTRVTNMGFMFSGCSNLIELNITNFIIKNTIEMRGMLGKCSDELKKNKIFKKSNLSQNAFYDI